jgi:hypothetical protein
MVVSLDQLKLLVTRRVVHRRFDALAVPRRAPEGIACLRGSAGDPAHSTSILTLPRPARAATILGFVMNPNETG